MTNTAKTPATEKDCLCSAYANVTTGERNACYSSTRSLFAPGHDAKLVGLLIRAGVKDQFISDGIKDDCTSAEIAGRFGFYNKVMEGIRKGKAKSVAKANKKAVRDLEKSLGIPAPSPVAEATETPKKGRGTTFSATYEGVTETRTSKTRTYTHAAVYKIGTKVVIGSWHSAEVLAAKGTNGMKPIAVVPVTVVK